MGILNADYTVYPDTISCADLVQANLTLCATPDMQSNSTDIVLLLDRSGSMYGTPLCALQNGVKQFLSILDTANTGQISGNTCVSIVTFSDTAKQETPFLTDTDALCQAVDTIIAEGATNHAAGFATAVSLLQHRTNRQKIIVLFTDGQSSDGSCVSTITNTAKAQGILIYGILLQSAFCTETPQASDWVTQPSSDHLLIAPTAQDLEARFADLANHMVQAVASHVHIICTISDMFSVSEFLPSNGSIQPLSNNRYLWYLDTLCKTDTACASLQIKLQYIGTTTAQVQPLTQITYQDSEQHNVTFPLQTVSVRCPYAVEPCPKTVSFDIDSNQSQVSYDLGHFDVQHFGTILECSLTLRQVCPNHQTALALILTETDHTGTTHPRGFQTFTIPAHQKQCPQDIVCNHIRFILPALPLADETTQNCQPRNLHMQVLAHHIDTAFHCDTE